MVSRRREKKSGRPDDGVAGVGSGAGDATHFFKQEKKTYKKKWLKNSQGAEAVGGKRTERVERPRSRKNILSIETEPPATKNKDRTKLNGGLQNHNGPVKQAGGRRSVREREAGS